jgi:hypothetical protein
MKKQYVFLAAAIIVLSAYLALRSTDKIHYELPELPKIQKKDITALSMEKQGRRLVLKKDGDSWKTDPDKYLAASEQMDRILDSITSFALTDMVSQAKSYDRFNLTDHKKTTVKAFSGDKCIREFDMGGIAGTGRHTFVRIPGDDRVYHARGNLADLFTADIDEVRDKTVLMFNPNEIATVRLDHLDAVLIIDRAQVPESPAADAGVGEGGQEDKTSIRKEKEVTWKAADGRPVDEEALTRLLSSVSELKCQKFIYDRKKEDYSKPRYAVTFTGARPYVLSLYSEGPEEKEKPVSYQVVSSESDSPFVLPQWKADEIIRGIETLMKAAKPAPPEKKNNT